MQLHEAIMQNRPPGGTTWESAGARNTNIRIGIVFLAEAIHRMTRVSISGTYWFIDTSALWLALVLLFVYLKEWFDSSYSTIGLLYFISILPLTYFLHYFHPWDRPSLVLWILIAFLVKRNWMLPLALSVSAAMLVKYDSVVAPGLYWLAWIGRNNFWRITARTFLLMILSFGMLVGLMMAFPGGSSGITGHDLLAQIARNFRTFLSMRTSYPPLLAHLIPTVLALYGWRQADRVARAGVLFGLLVLVPSWLIASNFEEVRAEVALTILLLPAALIGLRRLLGDARTVDQLVPLGSTTGLPAQPTVQLQKPRAFLADIR
jgi:hypothetical protein